MSGHDLMNDRAHNPQVYYREKDKADRRKNRLGLREAGWYWRCPCCYGDAPFYGKGPFPSWEAAELDVAREDAVIAERVREWGLW